MNLEQMYLISIIVLAVCAIILLFLLPIWIPLGILALQAYLFVKYLKGKNKI
jgi:hypothetical protein